MRQHQGLSEVVRLDTWTTDEEGLTEPSPDRVGLKPVEPVIAPILKEMVAVLRVGEDVSYRDLDRPLLERQDLGRVEARGARGEGAVSLMRTALYTMHVGL